MNQERFRKVKRKLGALLYYPIARHLPASYSSLHLGQTAFRRFCGKLMLQNCGRQVNIEKGAIFSSKVSLGDYSGIGVNAKIYGTCNIGKYVMMGEDVTIITRNHQYSRTDIPMMHQGFGDEKTVEIEDDCWIGDRVIILPGVHIGRGCVIGAGSVVTKDLSEYSIVAGVPARVIRNRKNEINERGETVCFQSGSADISF